MNKRDIEDYIFYLWYITMMIFVWGIMGVMVYFIWIRGF